MPRPFAREVTKKNWGSRRIFNKFEYNILPSNWLENEPHNDNVNEN